jgi:hypothetical protein
MVRSVLLRLPGWGNGEGRGVRSRQFSKERISSPGDRPAGFRGRKREGVEWQHLLITCEEANALTKLRTDPFQGHRDGPTVAQRYN